MLSNGLREVNDTITTNAMATYMLDDLTFMIPSIVTSFYAYYVSDGLIQYQIWRASRRARRSTEETFELIAKFDYEVIGAPGLFGVSHRGNEDCFEGIRRR